MHRGTAFGRVDHFAREEPRAKALEIGFVGEIEQCDERVAVDRVLREIDRKILETGREAPRALRVGGKERLDVARGWAGGEGGETRPGRFKGGYSGMAAL